MAHCIEGKKLFVDDKDRNEFLSRLGHHLAVTGYKCLAWSLMDTHFHLLVQTNHLPMAELMQPLNSGYARYYNKRYERRGYLLQDRFKSVLCQDQNYAAQLIKCIYPNPLRARMDGNNSMLPNLEVSWDVSGILHTATVPFGVWYHRIAETPDSPDSEEIYSISLKAVSAGSFKVKICS